MMMASAIANAHELPVQTVTPWGKRPVLAEGDLGRNGRGTSRNDTPLPLRACAAGVLPGTARARRRGWWRHAAKARRPARGWLHGAVAPARSGRQRHVDGLATRSTFDLSELDQRAALRPARQQDRSGPPLDGGAHARDAVRPRTPFNPRAAASLETNSTPRSRGVDAFSPRPAVASPSRLRLLPPEPLSAPRRRVVGRHGRFLPPQPVVYDAIMAHANSWITMRSARRFPPISSRLRRVDDPDRSTNATCAGGGWCSCWRRRIVERGQRDRRLADEINRYSDNPISAFDFPLRYRLKDACDTHGYSLRRLAEVADRDGERPDRAVTFVDNHDFRAATPARSSTTS